MSVTNLRWTIQVICFCVLIFGGLIGIWLGGFLPTFVCRYVDPNRAGTCFFYTYAKVMRCGTWAQWITLAELILCFSLSVIVIGRAWCGWICPFGFLQDVLDLIRRKLHIGYIRFPERLRSSLGCIKWIFLFFALLIPLWEAFPVLFPTVARDMRYPFCQLCPAKYILPLVIGDPSRIAVSLGSATTITMSTLGLTFSALAIIGALIKRRFWCPYCPLGLLLSFYKKISFIKLKKDCQKCTMCEVCYNVCPVEIQQVFKERENEDVTFTDCTLCLRCVEYCPEDGALRATFLGKTIYKSTSKGFFSRQHIIPAVTDEKHQKRSLEHINE